MEQIGNLAPPEAYIDVSISWVSSGITLLFERVSDTRLPLRKEKYRLKTQIFNSKPIYSPCELEVGLRYANKLSSD